MNTAMQCNGGIYRVELESGRIEIYDTYEELTEYYTIVGVLSSRMALTFVVNAKAVAI